MRMRFETSMILVSSAMILLALWVIADVWRGSAGPEDLIPMVTIFLSSVVLILGMTRRLLKGGLAPRLSPTADAVVTTQDMRRIERWVRATVTLVTVLFTAVWVVRSGDLLMPILLGGLMLVVSLVAAEIVLRILRRQGMRA